jgi:hypothetical protein
MGQLYLWSAARREWARCPRDEITWLDRDAVSGGKDLSLHRAPRCAGLRYVHHRWELFSRDTTHRVFVAGVGQPGGDQLVSDKPLSVEAVRQAARHVLPVAAARYEAMGIPLEAGDWAVSIGTWIVRMRLEATAPVPPGNGAPPGQGQSTQAGATTAALDAGASGRRGGPPRPDAAARVRAYFERNATARMAMAFYYREYILGLPAPQPVPMMDVVIGLNLSGEGAVSDLKKLLQGMIWSERGHARDLADFLLASALLTPADLDQARLAVADNERRGVCALARQRLAYRPRG